MGYNITSKDDLIDVQTINAGCKKIVKAGMSFENCARGVETAADMCSIETLSVDNKSMQPIMLNIAEQIRKIKDILENFSVSVQGLAQDIYDEQYSELQQYLEKIKQEQAK